MGTEIVFVLIFPVVLICGSAALGFWWFAVAKAEQPIAISYMTGYLPLIVGFAVSMAGLALLTYIEGAAHFTWLVEHGYYTESQRPEYLPRRVVAEAFVYLVVVLPIICFMVIPCTVRLIRTRRLTLGAIGLRAVIGWVVLSLVGWLWNLSAIVPPYPLSDFLKSTVAPVLIYGLPIPLAALWFFRRGRMPIAKG
jgi:hypothetical protein